MSTSPMPGMPSGPERGTSQGLDDVLAIVAPPPITDGSQALAHDGYDVTEFRSAMLAYGRLARLSQEAAERLVTAPALLRDLFWSFHKRAPMVAPLVPLTAAYEFNRLIVEQIMGTVEWQQVREAGTPGDLLNSALATVGVASKALDALDQSTVEQVNQLAEAESGAAELFSRAEALDELAAQAQGDRAAQLFAQAQAARQEAEQQQASAEQLAEALAQDQEAIEDATRRAGRQGLQHVEGQIDGVHAAVAAFGGAAGVGHGGEQRPLTTKEKIALALQVGKSRRLKEIAALCGRFTRIALQVQKTKVKHPPDEITSITQGSDLAHVLPSEIALLTDPLLEDLFFLKFAEGRLMQYALIGNERQGQGPIVVALDSSGSMSNSLGGMTKEVWSKAVALALLAIARLQQRDFALIHFSSTGQLRQFDFPKGRGDYNQVVAAVDFFFNGGTVYEPWMAAALKLVEDSKYNRADVICISDGEPNTINDAAWQAWQQRRAAREMRAFGVLIGTDTGAAGVLSRITDALLTLDNLREDLPVLETLFAV